MTDTEKIDALRALIHATVHAVKVANGMTRGSNTVARVSEERAINAIARSWLGRRLTPEELDTVG